MSVREGKSVDRTAYILHELNRTGLPGLTADLSDTVPWSVKRERIRERWLHYVGPMPDRVPVRYDVLHSRNEGSYRHLHIRYAAPDGDAVTALLLVPLRALDTQERLPAVLALHPTAPFGKEDVASPRGRDNRKYGIELAERGYVVLAPDTITAGERKDAEADYYHTAGFYKRYPEWSAVGKMLADHMQGVDVLQSLSYVRGDGIGAIGHSLGGYNAFFLAGLDSRIRAVAVSCGLSTFYGDPDPGRWGQRPWFTHLPKITEDLERGAVPFDFHEIAALAAPTPFLCWIAQRDQYMPHWRHIGEAAVELDGLYRHLGHADRFRSLIGNAAHDFPQEIRELAYDFLDQWLKEAAR